MLGLAPEAAYGALVAEANLALVHTQQHDGYPASFPNLG